MQNRSLKKPVLACVSLATVTVAFAFAFGALAADRSPSPKKATDPQKKAAERAATATPVPVAIPTSYMPVVPEEDFDTVMNRMKSEKAAIEKKQADLLAQRYDLAIDQRQA